MKKLSNIKKVELYKNYPTKWDDLNWSLSEIDIRNPLYLYSITEAIYERLNDCFVPMIDPERQYTRRTGLEEIMFTRPQFTENCSFTFSYFSNLYSLVTSALFSFINIEKWERAYRYENQKTIMMAPHFEFLKHEVDQILGYDWYELPLSNQKYDYYSKFLLGMKNCIVNMKWKHVDIWVTSTYTQDSYGNSPGERKKDDDGKWVYTNGNFTDCWSDLIEDENEKTRKLTQINVGSSGGSWYNKLSKTFYYENQKLHGSTETYTCSIPHRTLKVKTFFYMPFASDIKIYYVPFALDSYSGVYDDTKVFNHDKFSKKVVLYAKGRTKKDKVFHAPDFQITKEMISFKSPPFFEAPGQTKTLLAEESGRFYFIGFFDVSQGCKWK